MPDHSPNSPSPSPLASRLSPPSPTINVAAYQFAALTELKALRADLLNQCRADQLKGTILLSTEGVNLFVAGEQAGVQRLLERLRRVPGLEKLMPKISESRGQPFNRMLVRIKKEIIAFGVEGIHPERHTSRKLPAAELKRWLDEGRPIHLLDTRNDYEVKLGTFRGATTLPIDHFREFPGAVRQLPSQWRQEPVVMFCTGGIRCEKAGPFLERAGYSEVWQLDGGILKYFEECGGAHYDGECFVFDQRVGVDPALRETDSAQCFRCLSPLTPEDQEDDRYQPPRSCPYCHQPSEAQQARNLQQRQIVIQRATTPLPGSVPYENRRPVLVPPGMGNRSLLDFLSILFAHTDRAEWARLCELGRWVDREGRVVAADHPVKEGERYQHVQLATLEPEIDPDIRLIHEDEAIIVVRKPAPLPVHPSGRFNRNTLQYILQSVYAPQKPRPAHRLDANTTGLQVWTRTRHFAGILQPQFATGEVGKVYLVRVAGSPPLDEWVNVSPISNHPGPVGSRDVDSSGGLPARTEFRVLRRFPDATTLLEARPLTGRTNQIRVHAWGDGWPVCGDSVYLAHRQLGGTQTLALADSPLCLHAWQLSFNHPQTGERVEFTAASPSWAD